MDNRMQNIQTAAEYVSSIIKDKKPGIGIVLGSGLGKLGEQISDPVVIPYKEIPGFPVSTAVGHKGNFIIGELGGKVVIAMQGRFHYYEGYPMELVTIGMRVMARLGIEYVFVSNAAGGLNQGFKIGDLMIIQDHINLLPNPLIGPNLDAFGTRFPDMTCAYDFDLIEKAEKIAAQLGYQLHRGVYVGNTGPTYETPAEVRFYRQIGGDAVGMSTVPEVIVARHCGLKVFGMSVITNISNMENKAKVLNDGDDVVRAADAASDRMSAIFKKLIETL